MENFIPDIAGEVFSGSVRDEAVIAEHGQEA